MTPRLRRGLQAGVIVMAVLARVCERIDLLLRSNAQLARRTAGRFQALKRKELEVDRLDRLLNPGDYLAEVTTLRFPFKESHKEQKIFSTT